MKTILVPVDFSDTAHTALRYAMMIAVRNHSRIILLHAYRIEHLPRDAGYKEVAAERKLVQDTVEQQLQKLAALLDEAGLESDYTSEENEITDSIIQQVMKRKIDLVVMGTQGADRFLGAIGGSKSSIIIENATCPVILIPSETPVSIPKRLVFATNYHQGDIEALKEMVKLGRLFSAELKVIHIAGDEPESLNENMARKQFLDKVAEQVTYDKLSFSMLAPGNVAEKIFNYIDRAETSVLGMTTHKHGFFEKLVGQGYVRELSLETELPLMTFHHKV